MNISNFIIILFFIQTISRFTPHSHITTLTRMTISTVFCHVYLTSLTSVLSCLISSTSYRSTSFVLDTIPFTHTIGNFHNIITWKRLVIVHISASDIFSSSIKIHQNCPPCFRTIWKRMQSTSKNSQDFARFLSKVTRMVEVRFVNAKMDESPGCKIGHNFSKC